MSEHQIRPIWGFGWRGWVLLPIAVWLAWCALGGVDLQMLMMRLCWERLGERFVWNVVIRKLMFGAYWPSLTGVVCGPSMLIPVLIAMHLSPRRWAWWHRVAVAVWLVLNPWLCIELAERLVRVLGPRSGWIGYAPGAGRQLVALGELLGVVLAQLAPLWLIAWLALSRPAASPGERALLRRFGPFILLAAGVVLGVLQWWLDWPSSPTLARPYWIGMGAAWHLAAAYVLIAGSVQARRSVTSRPWLCAGCGYDRQGLAPGAACPECGAR